MTLKKKIAELEGLGYDCTDKTAKEVNEMYNIFIFLPKKEKVDEPKVDEPKVAEPKVDEPKVDEPKVDEPKVDEPKVDEPKADEPKVDEPKVDDPKVAENVSIFDSIDELKGEIGKGEPSIKQETKQGATKPLVERTRKKIPKNDSQPDSFRIDGYMLMLLTDTVAPFLFAMIHNMLEKRFKIEATQLALTSEQNAKLTPLAAAAADYLQFNINPVLGFFLMSGVMYGNNLYMLRGENLLAMESKKTKDEK